MQDIGQGGDAHWGDAYNGLHRDVKIAAEMHTCNCPLSLPGDEVHLLWVDSSDKD